MKLATEILASLLTCSFLFAHGDARFILASHPSKPQTEKTGATCTNEKCCCDHRGPDGNRALCDMCYTPSSQARAAGECCLYQANCDPTKAVPIPTVNKDLRGPTGKTEILCPPQISYLNPITFTNQAKDFETTVFHPPPA